MLICAITNSFIINVSSDAFRPDETDTILDGTYYALAIILIMGYCLLYIPGILLFDWLIKQFSYKNYLFYILMGAMVGIFGSIICLFVTRGEITARALLTMPQRQQIVTIPAIAILGAVYGLAYRLLFVKIGNESVLPGKS